MFENKNKIRRHEAVKLAKIGKTCPFMVDFVKTYSIRKFHIVKNPVILKKYLIVKIEVKSSCYSPCKRVCQIPGPVAQSRNGPSQTSNSKGSWRGRLKGRGVPSKPRRSILHAPQVKPGNL